jgi:D-tyrosyl-tRNA(Tyr) deacylase
VIPGNIHQKHAGTYARSCATRGTYARSCATRQKGSGNRYRLPDQSKLMNLSILDVGGQMLVVSQFTLYGDCRKGRRPSYSNAAPPDQAEELYQTFIQETARLEVPVVSGKFQAMMDVELINQGPVTLLLDSAKSF